MQHETAGQSAGAFEQQAIQCGVHIQSELQDRSRVNIAAFSIGTGTHLPSAVLELANGALQAGLRARGGRVAPQLRKALTKTDVRCANAGDEAARTRRREPSLDDSTKHTLKLIDCGWSHNQYS